MTEAKGLLEHATPLPWAARPDPRGDGALINQHERSLSDGTPILGIDVAEFYGSPDPLADAVLAVYAVNHLPDLASMAKWIVQETEGKDRIWDHACLECTGPTRIVIEGFRCAVHRARDVAPNTIGGITDG